MGFPTYEDVARQFGVCVDDHVSLGPAYSIENAMHVANVGVVSMLALLCIEVNKGRRRLESGSHEEEEECSGL